MSKFLKISAILIGVVTGLVALVLVVAIFVIDPNAYKDDLVGLVKQQTGRILVIDGDLGLTVFPRIGVSVNSAYLSNARGFGPDPMVRIAAGSVSVALMPLFTGRVVVDAITLNGLQLNLTKAADGRTNWDDLAQPVKRDQKPESPESGGPALAAFAIGRIEINNAIFSWRDDAAGARYTIRDFDLVTGSVALSEPIDLKLTLTLEQVAPPRRVPVNLDVQLVVNEAGLELRTIDLRADDSRITGTVNLRFNEPVYRFDLVLDQIDIDKYLSAPDGAASDAKVPAVDAASKPEPVEISLALLRTLNVQGKLAIGKLKAFGIRSEQVVVQAQARNGQIMFGPNSAKLYGGSYAGHTAFDVSGATPRLRFDEKLTTVQLGSFLKDAAVFDNYSGTGNVELKLTAQGSDAAAIKRTLNGDVAIDLRDGKIEGVNFQKMVQQARAVYDQARGQAVEAKPKAGDTTAFQALTATMRVTNGVVRNDDLSLTGPLVAATGAGTADLVKETFDYGLKVTLTEEVVRKSVTVPVHISGTFTKPRYRPEFGEVLKEKAQQAIEKKLDKKLDKLRQKLLR